MRLKDELLKRVGNKNVTVFVDMDGVISFYDVGKPHGFMTKRPLYTNIEKLKELDNLDNVKLCILSVCRKDFQIKEKNEWLDDNASFFKEENRNIISKQNNPDILSKTLKTNFLKNYMKTSDDLVAVIDDDNGVLNEIMNELPEVILFQDSILID